MSAALLGLVVVLAVVLLPPRRRLTDLRNAPPSPLATVKGHHRRGFNPDVTRCRTASTLRGYRSIRRGKRRGRSGTALRGLRQWHFARSSCEMHRPKRGVAYGNDRSGLV